MALKTSALSVRLLKHWNRFFAMMFVEIMRLLALLNDMTHGYCSKVDIRNFGLFCVQQFVWDVIFGN